MSTSKLEETRKRVQNRLAEIGEAADQEVKRSLRVRDAAIAVLGVIGLLFAARRVAKAIAQQTGESSGRRKKGLGRRATRI